jgi:predicted ATP-dependent endonuclease of OLD family
MQAEFNMQINNLYDAKRMSEITLKIKDTEIIIRVDNNEYIDISNNFSLNTEVLYIDDPYAMDNLRNSSLNRQNRNLLTHREHLTMCLADMKTTLSVKEALGEIIVSKKLDKVFEKLNSVCSGKMVRSNRSFSYTESKDVTIDIVNVSTGLKTFAIIKTLLLNGCLEEKGSIVLDEPEIHLHPEWQLVFAELIVLLQKEFNMHILINTHSPYFLNAVEVYSHKHGIASKCKYYLAEISGATSVISDVSNNIEKIYEKLARPLQILENERYSDD